MPIKIKSRSNLAIFLSFVALTVILLIFHEPWRDEAQQWLFVKNQSFISMMSHLHFEGHPALWYILIWPLTRLGLGYFSLSVMHAVIVLLCGWLIVYKSPFRTCLKVLFLFSAPVGYEYNAVTRSYIVVLLLLLLIAMIFPKRHTKYRNLYGVLLILLINTHLLAALAAFSIIIYEFITLFCHDAHPDNTSKEERISHFIRICMYFSIGFFLLFLALIGERDVYGTSGLYNLLKADYLPTGFYIFRNGMCGEIDTVVSYFFNALHLNLLNKNLIVLLNNTVVAVSLLALFFYRFKPALLMGVFCMLYSVMYFTGIPLHYWNICLVFVFFIFAFWISKTTPFECAGIEQAWNNLIGKFQIKGKNIISSLAAISLALNFILAGMWVFSDIRTPYSQSSSAARYIKANGYDTTNTCIITPNVPQSSAILPYLKNIRYFSLPGWSNKISYCPWNSNYVTYEPSDATIFNYARNQFTLYHKTPLVIYGTRSYNIPDDFICIYSGINNAVFIKDEQYSIYTLKQTQHK